MKCSKIICEVYELKKEKRVVTLEAGTFSQPESLYFYSQGHEVWLMEPILHSFKVLLHRLFHARPHTRLGRLLYRHEWGMTEGSDLHKSRCLNAAISDKTEKSTIQECLGLPGHSSLSHGEEHKMELSSMGVESGAVETQCYTYKHLTERIIEKKVNILILDIEGHEVTVLESIKKEIEQKDFPDIICIECGYDWQERLELLEGMGYEADFFEYNNCYLSLRNSDLIVSKNEDLINQANQRNPHFVWNNKCIYKNHLAK